MDSTKEWLENHKMPVFVAILIVITLIMIFIYYTRCNNRYLDGLWICDEEFCNESELTGNQHFARKK